MSVLDLLGLHGDNAGTCLGPNQWSEDGARWITSYNPSTGESLGRVRATTSVEYERLVEHAQAVAKRWAEVPAPQRGEAVRLLGQALREHKSQLGQLISLEMGKILVEERVKFKRPSISPILHWAKVGCFMAVQCIQNDPNIECMNSGILSV